MTFEDPIIRDISGFPNYQIAENGIVYNKTTGDEVSQCINKGYLHLNLALNKKVKKNPFIHRLLMIAFVDNPENYPVVDHIDRNSLNNRLENLRWTTNSGNMRNTKTPAHNTSGIKGVYKCDTGQGKVYWRVNIYTQIGKLERKCFPYTNEGKLQAIAWRREMELKYEYL